MSTSAQALSALPTGNAPCDGFRMGAVARRDYETGDIVFDLRVKAPELIQLAYRSEPIPTIYPGGYTISDIGG